MRARLFATLTLIVAAMPVSSVGAGCLKDNIVQGGLDRSLPCYFRSPLPWEIHKVAFGTNSSSLDEQAKAILDQQADVLSRHPDLALTIWGHVDHEEARRSNGTKLGFQRADVVRNYLIAHGIAAERIATDSRGDRAMIVNDRTENALSAMRYATTETEDNPRFGR